MINSCIGKRTSRCCLLISLMLVACAPGAAQYTDRLHDDWNNPTGTTITNIILDRYAQSHQEKRNSRQSAKPSDASLHFRSTGTQLKTQEIANLIGSGNPQVPAIMTALLNEYEKGARAAGKPNDLALALSFFFATNSSVYHDAQQPSDRQMLELRETIAEALIEGNALNGASDRQKQEMYETLVLFTGFALAAYQEGKQNSSLETVKVSQQLAGQNLLAITGISPDKISFTNRGLSIDSGAAVTSKSTQSNRELPTSEVAPDATVSNSEFLEFDPFPDKPRFQPQQPLIGRLRKTITTNDLAGTWEIGGASVTTYVSSGTSTHTDASFFGKKYFIRSDGGYDSRTQSRASNTTIRESDSGTIVLSGGFVTLKSSQKPAMRYQFVAFMSLPNGAAIISLIYIGDGAPLDGDALRANCGHAHGYVTCGNGEEWVRIP
jgi:hypothetical protein